MLLISVDAMHSLDLANCTKGIDSINRGGALVRHGVNYQQAQTPRPSELLPRTHRNRDRRKPAHRRNALRRQL